MGSYSSSGTPKVRGWRPLESYAAGESLPIPPGDRMYYAGLLLQSSRLALTILLFQSSESRWKTTPQGSIQPTPNRRRIEDIEELLTKAKRSQSALKDLASSTGRFI